VKRRHFLTLLGGAAAGWPLAARAQQLRTPTVGYLGTGSLEVDGDRLRSFLQGLAETGFVEGKNVAIEYRWMQLGRPEGIPALATDLVGRPVAVIVVMGGPAGTRAAMKATATIPIVFFTGGDPVAFGLVTSLARPGRNVTGVTSLNEEIGPNRLELMHELLPQAKDVALLVNPNDSARAGTQWKDMTGAAASLGLRLHIVEAITDRDFDAAFARLTQLHAEALVLDPNPLLARHTELVVRTVRLGIPTISFDPEFVTAGGLISYASRVADSHRVVGIYTGRILKGEKPADLPVQQATKIELSINLKTAKVLGLTVPPAVLARADEVIE